MKTVNELTLSYKTKAQEKFQVKSSATVAPFLREIWEGIDVYESFYVLMLNRRNEIVNYIRISQGGISGTVVDKRLIFAAALISGASAIILAHNHPSGNTQPSTADKSLTNQVVKAGDLLDIPVLDHIIVTETSHFGFADHGMV